MNSIPRIADQAKLVVSTFVIFCYITRKNNTQLQRLDFNF